MSVSFLLTQMTNEEDYPLLEKDPGGEEPAKEKTSVRLLKSLDADIQFIADLFNEFDKVKLERAKALAAKSKKPQVKAGKKWKKSSVMELFIQAGRDRWANRMGGMPATPEDRETYLSEAKQHFEAIAAKAASERTALAKKQSK